jgi:hypothetical protein
MRRADPISAKCASSQREAAQLAIISAHFFKGIDHDVFHVFGFGAGI